VMIDPAPKQLACQLFSTARNQGRYMSVLGFQALRSHRPLRPRQFAFYPDVHVFLCPANSKVGSRLLVGKCNFSWSARNHAPTVLPPRA